jgi:hypothetical protein
MAAAEPCYHLIGPGYGIGGSVLWAVHRCQINPDAGIGILLLAQMEKAALAKELAGALHQWRNRTAH